jgi:hypothetical protein
VAQERADRSGPRGGAYQRELPLGTLRSYQREEWLEEGGGSGGHSIVVICYQLPKRKVPYEELGEDYYVGNRSKRLIVSSRKAIYNFSGY